MISKLGTILFNPRLIAQYINDSMSKIIFLCSLFFLLIGTAYTLSYDSYNMNGDMESQMLHQLRKSEGLKDVRVDNYMLQLSNNVVIELEEINFYFVNELMEYDIKKDCIIFTKNQIIFKYASELVKQIYHIEEKVLTYNEVDIKELTFTNGNQGYRIILSLVNNLYREYTIYHLPLNFGIWIAKAIIGFLLNVIIVYVFTINVNRSVVNPFRYKIIIYSCFWTLVFDFIGASITFPYLSYIGIFISYLFASIALKAIIRIEVRK